MLRQQILAALSPLIGLPLSDISRAANMRMFGFGELVMQESVLGERRSVSPLALHIQCPWRIEGPAGIVTGRADLFEPQDPQVDVDWDNWDYVNPPSLQDKLLREYFEQHHAALVVKAIDADEYGGAVIEFQRGDKLRWFPAGTVSEDWRIFGPGDLDSHFVISGGKFEIQSD